MYEQHWRLDRPAFRSSASAEFFFSGRSHAAAILKLRYLVEQRQGIAVLTGMAGIGKSCVLEQFRHQLPETSGPVVQVLFPQLTSGELIAYLTTKLEAASGIEVPASDDGMDHLLRRLETQLLRLTEAGRHPVFLIDDAHLITDRRVFQTLQLLLNYQQAERMEFSMILAGQPELIGQVKRYAALLDRLAFLSTLTSLEADETAAYVRHRLVAAGGTGDTFEDSALATVHELSDGVPRRINRLCDFALLVGYADNLDQVTSSQIEAVAEEMTLAAA